MGATKPGDISVDPAGVTTAGNGLCALADKLQGIEDTWSKVAASGGAAVGDFSGPQAYDAMYSAWKKQIDVLVKALSELCGRTTSAASTYVNIDAQAYPTE